MWDWIVDAHKKTLEWVLDLFLWAPRKIAEALTDALVSVLHSVDVPEWLAQANSSLDGMPEGVYWFMDMMAVPEGFAIVMSAWAIRFLIRRIPVIG